MDRDRGTCSRPAGNWSRGEAVGAGQRMAHHGEHGRKIRVVVTCSPENNMTQDGTAKGWGAVTESY